MHLATPTKKSSRLPLLEEVRSKARRSFFPFDGLPFSLKTPGNMALLRIYFLIPQPSVRHFLLVLLTRIAGNADGVIPLSDLAQAEYLLVQYTQLPNDGMRDKVSALVRQLCVANGGDIGGLYGTVR